MSFHLVPASSPATADPGVYRRLAGGPERALAVHALAADCSCSRIVARRLIARGPHERVAEAVVWAGRDEELETGLARAGFPLERDDDAFAGVPQLLVFTRGGNLRYAGGYSSRLLASRSQARDLEIIARALGPAPPRPYPVYGCTMGADSRRARDPLGLKY